MILLLLHTKKKFKKICGYAMMVLTFSESRDDKWPPSSADLSEEFLLFKDAFETDSSFLGDNFSSYEVKEKKTLKR